MSTEYYVTPRQPGVRPQDPPDYDGIVYVYVFTNILDAWVQPAVQDNVQVIVANAQGFVSGMCICCEGAGYYQVVSADALNRMTLYNYGGAYNQPPGTPIAPGKITTTSLPGPPGSTGPPGPVGPPLTPQGSVPSKVNLPPIGNVGDLYMALDTGHAWGWSGSVWVDLGPFQGPAGPQGLTGPAGPQGIQGNTGATGQKGDTGATGLQGPPGIQGPPGPNAVSTDSANAAKLGSDNLIWVPKASATLARF